MLQKVTKNLPILFINRSDYSGQSIYYLMS